MIGERHPNQLVSIGYNLLGHVREAMVNFLKRYKHVFAWTPTNMVGVDRKLIEHKFMIKPGVKEVKQKKKGPRRGSEQGN